MTLRRIFAAWDRWWLGDVPPHALALVRIAVGVFLFGYWLHKLPAVPQLFSNQGIQTPLIYWGYPVIVWLLQSPPVQVAAALYAVLMCALVCLAIGFRPQRAAVVAFCAATYFWLISLHQFGTSFDLLYLFVLLALTFSNTGGTYSLDMRLAHGSWTAWKPVCALSHRLIQVQITATYVGVCWQKFVLSSWQGGEVMYYSQQGIWATPLSLWFVRTFPWPWVYDVQVHVVEFIQFIIPIGLWVPGYRWYGTVAGVTFHILILVFLGMGWFLAMLPAYLLFPPPERIREWLFAKIPAMAGPEVR